jgi:hypothetical protein
MAAHTAFILHPQHRNGWFLLRDGLKYEEGRLVRGLQLPEDEGSAIDRSDGFSLVMGNPTFLRSFSILSPPEVQEIFRKNEGIPSDNSRFRRF